MSEAVAEVATRDVTAGALLRQAREACGLHVAALAVSLKVPVRKLEALENDRWDQLSDAVFVRALASSVCRTLKIDPRPVLERLPQTSTPRLVQVTDGINAPFRAPGDGAQPTLFSHLGRPVFLAVFALLLGALVLILLPVTRQEAAVAQSPRTVPMVASTPVVAPIPAAPAATVAASATNATAPESAPAAATPAATTASAIVAPASAGAGAVVAAASPKADPLAATAASPSPGDVIFIRAKGPSWVEVTDARGAVGIRKVLAGGETAAASGELPLQVTIGRSDMTEVQVRGQPYDLRRVSKDNVARFQVK